MMHKNHIKTLEDIRVVFAYKNFAAIKNANISHIGLGLAAQNTAETLNEHGIMAEVWAMVDPQDLIDRLEEEHQKSSAKNSRKLPITHVIVCAPWVPTKVFAELAHKYRHIKFMVNSHSNVGFLMADRGGIRLLREAAILEKSISNFGVSGNCKRFTDWATIAWDAPVTFLPNLYSVSKMKFKRKPFDGETLRIGCFGAVRPLKNGITAAAAAVLIGKSLGVKTELWFSSGREEGGNATMAAIENLVARIPNFKVKHKAWAPWREFRKFVGTMDLNLQPSFTESFNMVTADSLFESVACVTSNAINWVPDYFIAEADNAEDIARVGECLLDNPSAVYDGQRALKRYVKEGLKAWKRFLLE